jgi:adenylate cyclase
VQPSSSKSESKSSEEEQTLLVQFKSDTTRKVFDSLVDCFVEDYMVRKYVAEKSGWRTLGEISQRAHVSPSLLYGKHSTFGTALDEPVRRGLVETRIFPGERGRGGEVMRLKIAYDKEPIKEYVNKRVMLGRGRIKSEQKNTSFQTAVVATSGAPTGQKTTIEEESASQRRIAAIMFTDIVGYTTLAQSNERQALEILERHNQLLRPFFPKYNGREVKTIGDSFLVEFDSALDAVLCAIEIQKFLHDHNISTQEAWEKIKVRIGIHLGDVVRKGGGDILGDSVNLASRIQPLAEPEGISISQQIYDQIYNKIEYSLEQLEHPEFKNIKFQTSIYRILLPWSEKKKVERQSGGLFVSGTISEVDRRRIAVLPFSNISPDPKDEYFADGMTEELISTMSKISGLKVIARTSVMAFKGERMKIREIAEELKVGTVLEGSVRKAKDKLRITVQLIDSKSSEHLWSESYDREMRDVFSIQSDISERVARALRVQLLSLERIRIEKEPTKNTEAHAMCLRGIFYSINQVNFWKAIECFQEAIELDSNYAVAYAWLADSYGKLAGFGLSTGKDVLSKIEEASKRALELDPNLAEAHLGLTWGKYLMHDWHGMEEEIRKALELNPRVTEGREYLATALDTMGRFDEAYEEATKALEINPLSRFANLQGMGLLLFNMRQYDKAIEHCRKVLKFDPDFKQVHNLIGWCYYQKSMYQEAIEEFNKSLEPSKGRDDLNLIDLACAQAKSGQREEAIKTLDYFEEFSKKQFVPHNMISRLYLALGEKDKVLNLLEGAYERGEYNTWIKVNPTYDDVRLDPRFAALLRKMGLEP